MTEIGSTKRYDLEERTLKFANEDQDLSQGSQEEPVLAQAYPGRWPGGKKTGEALVNEATELMRIFGSIAEKAK